MKYGTKRGIAAAAYLVGMVVAAFGLGYICGGDDCHEDEASRGRFEWDPDEKPSIEWAEGGEEEFYKALEEADKEEENESES